MSNPTEKDIINFMLIEISKETKIPQDEIDINLPLSKLDMDSLAVTELCLHLGAFLNKPVQPYIAWDYPTIAKIASFLAI